jgi:glycosyltransferase involved in cell wall biosynthesis
VPVRWSSATEAQELASADLGVSWVPNDRWSRGKCGLKILQYMAAGLPVIANPVGVQSEMVRHGENGFLVRTPEEWIEAVGLLSRDPELRRQMGLAGRWLVEREFSVEIGADSWLQLLAPLPARVAV